MVPGSTPMPKLIGMFALPPARRARADPIAPLVCRSPRRRLRGLDLRPASRLAAASQRAGRWRPNARQVRNQRNRPIVPAGAPGRSSGLPARVAKLPLPVGSLLCYTTIMSKSVKVARKKRGRPATGKDPDPFLTARVPQEIIDSIESWAASVKISRSEAMRRLLKFGLERVPAQRMR